MKEYYATIIEDWVRLNFGQNEVDDPSWNIDALALEIALKTKLEEN